MSPFQRISAAVSAGWLLAFPFCIGFLFAGWPWWLPMTVGGAVAALVMIATS